MGYLIKFVSVVAAVLFWHLYHLDPNVAQVKDLLQLLHSETVHGHIAVGFILALLLDDGIGAGVSYVSVHRSTSQDSRFNNFAKREDK
jgi:hypothetical protein